MSGRETILVMARETSRPDYVAELITVEPMSFGARAKLGLYLMVPVRNEREADELSKRLSA